MMSRGSSLRSESKFWRDMKTKMVKHLLDIIILSRLRNVPSSGYDIILYVQEKNKMHINPGVVYSTIYSLERQGLVKGKLALNKRVYHITQDGLNYIDNVLNNFDEILKIIAMNIE